MFNIVFFAALRETLGCGQLNWQSEAISIAGLIQELRAQGENWDSALARPDLLCARNQQLCTPDEAITAGDEIAFFPPVTGG